ncbi:hypothetical protein [Frankia canadensis]|uniref:hypothetical protein n=1 Tax=Frankia canadensis TaxID=1836972 RepID=UPI001FAF8D4F|nr:hypothetical protein [Frankia canadensis]
MTPELRDLGAADGPARLVEAALAELGELDVLVNNVGGGDGGAVAGARTRDSTTAACRARMSL